MNQSIHGGWDSANGPVSPRRNRLREWTRTFTKSSRSPQISNSNLGSKSTPRVERNPARDHAQIQFAAQNRSLPYGPEWEHQPLTVITEPEMGIESRWLIYKKTNIRHIVDSRSSCQHEVDTKVDITQLAERVAVTESDDAWSSHIRP